GETPVAGITIYIDSNDNSILDENEIQTTTDTNGFYQFNNINLAPGTYSIRDIAPTGFTQQQPAPTITINPTDTTFNFTQINLTNIPNNIIGDISGTKLNDLNNDGIGETPVAGITIYIDSNNNNIRDENEFQAITDDNGFYLFDDINLPAGTYSIRDIAPTGFTQQQPAPTITINPTDTTFNFTQINLTNIPNNITPPGISITQTDGNTNVTEGLATDTYQIVLDSIPNDLVNIAIAPDNQIDLGAGPGIPITRSFDSTNALTPQIINVTAVDDAFAEGPHPGNITHNASSNDPNYNTPTVAFTVDGTPSNLITANITDNDTPAVITIQAAEGGFTGVYSLELNMAPTAPVTINVDTGDQIQPIAPITFDQTNWNSERLITVTAIDDFDIEGDHTATINHFATSEDDNFNGINVLPLVVDITDNDTAGVSINPTDIDATEGGATGSYEVVLTTQPTAQVTINFDTGNQIQPIAPITFDQTNWNVGRPINVAAIDDLIVEGNHIGTISHVATSEDINYNGLEISQVTTNITDNDTAGVSINPTDIDATEGGATGSYEVVLTTQPTALVTINFDTGNQIQPIAPITFDQTNWNVGRPINVAAIDDLIVEGNHIGTISHVATSEDINYNGLEI
ncbi:SdrD B-like domain-containing protein, partial [Okeania sp. SIO3B5]|uniref:SdrD B-like domain-containing protein n=1 Tax=Okeania sp. SIO3B5 TaxID=2607811 RepID=UPI0035C8DF0E